MENTPHYYRACTIVLVLILTRQQFKKMATWKRNVCLVELPASCTVLFVIVRWCHKRRQSATDNERWKSWLVGALCILQAWTDMISWVSNCLIWHSDVRNRYKYLLWTYFLCSLSLTWEVVDDIFMSTTPNTFGVLKPHFKLALLQCRRRVSAGVSNSSSCR